MARVHRVEEDGQRSVWQAHKAVISNNALLRPGGQRHALKLHGPERNDGRAETRWVTITDNRFYARRNPTLPAPTDVRILNNTVSAATADGTAFQIGAEVTSCQVRNNLLGAPASGAVLIAGGGGAGWTADHNLWTASPGFLSASSGDFRLASGSPAVDAGAATPAVREDFARAVRPLGAGPDLGAFESR